MSCLRENREEIEKKILSPYAVLALNTKGRDISEEEDEIRTCFQRDVDRITYSKAFRRLKHKTQVFLQPEGDHYRTRLTHTLEVTRIARTISRAIGLNEDLTEAIALGHDLGHTPFGHAGERALSRKIYGKFEHNEQSLRVVERLEKDGKGLNLTWEVRDGILCHTGEQQPSTLEGEVVRIADRIAYVNHDVDDAIRAGILSAEDIPNEVVTELGSRHSQRVNTFVLDIIETSMGKNEVKMSPQMFFIMDLFRTFLFDHVYTNPIAKSEERKVNNVVDGLYDFYLKEPDKLPIIYRQMIDEEGIDRVICDYISGMTDQYAIYTFNNIYVPYSWNMR